MSSDSGSDNNPSEDNEDDVQDDEDEEEEEEDDGEENEEEEEEEEESSNFEEDGLQFYEDVGEGLFRMLPTADRDDSNVVMIQHSFDNQDMNAPAPTSGRQSLPWNNFPFSFDLVGDAPLGSESNGINSHPVLVAHASLVAVGNNRSQRMVRQRRYQVQQSNPRHANPPVILQRYVKACASFFFIHEVM